MFGLRLGDNPQVVVTTTPRPIPLMRQLIKDETTVITKGSTYENKGNLAPAFLKDIIKKYEGTRLGRQELYAVLLEDTPGALWNLSLIEKYRITNPKEVPPLVKIVVAVDPAMTANEESDETGIIVIGRSENRHGYVLSDRSLIGTPNEWASAAVLAYRAHEANKIVAEVNAGGDMVTYTIHTIDETVPVQTVRASRGKYTRAEPVSSLYEKGEVHHVGGFPKLEDQMCSWVPGEDSPDRMDALVWGATELLLSPDIITINEAPAILQDYRG